MRKQLKASCVALLVGACVAALLFTCLDPTPLHLDKAFVYYFFSIALYGLPLYIPYMLLHHWLLQRSDKHTIGYSLALGAGLAVGITSLGALFHLLPDEPQMAALTIAIYAVAGALYGLVYYLVGIRVQFADKA